MHRILLILAYLLPTGGALAQDKYAVVVGVDTYDTSTFRNLQFASNDARELGRSLTSLGFKATVMTGQATSSRLHPTTPRKIGRVIEAVARSCEPSDTLLIALSGHGLQFSDDPLLPTGVRETYFCPSDAAVEDKSTLLPITAIVERMRACPAQRKLLLVDACQEQRLSANGQKKNSRRRIELGSFHENRRSVPSGMAVLFSCSNGQFSWEHEPLRHSVFTFQVLKYLRGEANQRYYDAGKLDLNGLVSFVAKYTNDYVLENNLTPDGQFPVLRGNSANWILGAIGKLRLPLDPRALRFQFIEVPPGSTYAFSIEDSKYKEFLVPEFTISETEVTVGQFRQFVEATGYRSKASACEGFSEAQGHIVASPEFSWKNVGWQQTDMHPVLNLCAWDVDAFLRWRGEQDGCKYRLPTYREYDRLVFGDAPFDGGQLEKWKESFRFREVDRWRTIWRNQFQPAAMTTQSEGAFGQTENYFQSTPVDSKDITIEGVVGLRSNFPERTSGGRGTGIFDPLSPIGGRSMADRADGELAGIRLIRE